MTLTLFDNPIPAKVPGSARSGKAAPANLPMLPSMPDGHLHPSPYPRAPEGMRAAVDWPHRGHLVARIMREYDTCVAAVWRHEYTIIHKSRVWLLADRWQPGKAPGHASGLLSPLPATPQPAAPPPAGPAADGGTHAHQ